jgi:hypothetical protein
MRSNQSVNADRDPLVLGLQLLAHVVADPDLGPRFLGLTGMTADNLRDRAADPQVLAALVDFLAANEADLIAAGDALAVPPSAIIAAGARLGGGAA